MKSEYRKKALSEALGQAGMAIKLKLYNLAQKNKPAKMAEVEPEKKEEEPEFSEEDLGELEKFLG